MELILGSNLKVLKSVKLKTCLGHRIIKLFKIILGWH